MYNLIPCYIKVLSSEFGLWPYKIISLISDKAKLLGGVKTGDSEKKQTNKQQQQQKKKKKKKYIQFDLQPKLEPANEIMVLIT